MSPVAGFVDEAGQCTASLTLGTQRGNDRESAGLRVCAAGVCQAGLTFTQRPFMEKYLPTIGADTNNLLIISLLSMGGTGAALSLAFGSHP